MQIHAYTYIYKHIHTYMNIYVQVLTYTYIYVHIRTYTSMKSAGSAGSAGGSAAGGSASGSASGSAGSDAGAAGSSWFVRVRPGYTVHSETRLYVTSFFFVRRISGSTSSLWRTKLGVPVQNVRSLQIPRSSRKPNINFQHSMEPPRPSTSD